MRIAGGRRRRGRLWGRVDAGPDDAAKGVVDDRLFGSGLGDDRMRRRGVFSDGAGLLRDGARMVMWVILRMYGGADEFWPWFGFRCVGAYVYSVKLVESVGSDVIEEKGMETNALLDRRRAA